MAARRRGELDTIDAVAADYREASVLNLLERVLSRPLNVVLVKRGK